MRVRTIPSRPAWLILLGLAVVAEICRAGELSWEPRELTLDVALEQQVVQADFKATNLGADPVRIEEIVTSCGCMAVECESYTVAPAETVTVSVLFDVSDTVGSPQRRLVVKHTGREAHTDALSVLIRVPPGADLSREILTWDGPNDVTEKSLDITTAADLPLSRVWIEEPLATGRAVELRLTEVETSRHYRLYARPTDMADGQMHPVKVWLNYVNGAKKPRYVYLQMWGG
ncbi:DUF1573 domain-containing protein [Synoicihabitans lomoniglobus]|uniref:DUF1573 domain-containing protein n=1 Tax=Synoicihabitans lomoniglobus TaxID=2909285 RepID=A0AAE9ZXP0_9BACT|nr:DUF1573 domain-containing protein [Opitutaceae bacterium LMO-M01]